MNGLIARKIDPKAISDELNRYSRQPFLDLLAEAITKKPTLAALQKLANKQPDRYGQYLATVGRLAGFSEKIETVKDIHHWIHNASDMELMNKNKELERELAEMKGEAIEVKKIDRGE